MAMLFLLTVMSACANTKHDTPLIRASFVDRDLFEGKWYVIANIPYFAEKNKIASSSTYKKLGENSYADIYEYQNRGFTGKIEQKKGSIKSLNDQNNQWQSTFYRVIKFKSDVLYFNNDERIMLLGHPSRKYGWLMAGEKTISEQQYKSAMQVFANNGYEILKFGKVAQLPQQLGTPGFQIIK